MATPTVRPLAELPRPAKMHVIDPGRLGRSEKDADERPELDADTGLPTTIKAFVVVKDPHMLVIPNFFSDAECEHLIELVDGYWIPSLVGKATYSSDEDYAKGNLSNVLSETRTSWSCMLRHNQTSVVERIEYRLASLAKMPVGQLERLNMVRYAPGELFNEHHDGKFRPKTIFVYLNDLPEGDDAGDTFFPFMGLSFRPRRGAAVMWSNVLPGEDEEDARMLHAGRAPSLGIKYGVNCFFNMNTMRLTAAVGADVDAGEAHVVRVGDLVGPSVAAASEGIADQSGSSAESPGGEAKAGAGAGGPTDPLANASGGGDLTGQASNSDDPTAQGRSENAKASGRPASSLKAYKLVKDPAIVAVPGVLNDEEAAHLLELAATEGPPCCVANSGLPGAALLRNGTEVLRTLDAEETSTVEAIECRLSACAGLSLGSLARLRVVRPGTQTGLCNRGCGPKSGYVCLCDSEEVLFVHLGLRLVLRRGDALFWPNVDWSTGKAVEDLRTLRKHLGLGATGEAEGTVGLDVFFHDGPVRDQQKLRTFVTEIDLLGAIPEPDGGDAC